MQCRTSLAYAELARGISEHDFSRLKEFYEGIIASAKSFKSFRASVLSVQGKGMTTEINRSMRFLGSVLDVQIESSESMGESVATVVALLEQKVDKQ